MVSKAGAQFRTEGWRAALFAAGLCACTGIANPSDNGAVGPSGGNGSSGNTASAGGSGPGSSGTSNASGGDGAAPGACTALTPVSRRLWRLSVAQFGNSVRDLVGLAQTPTLNNNGGTSEYAFFSDDAAVVDANLEFSIYQALQAQMPVILARIPALTACTSGEAQMACAQRFAQTFGERAFRRPLEASEVSSLTAVYSAGGNTDFDTGISGMIQALLLSPSFLHRTELGPSSMAPDATGTTQLAPFEVATQLSYLFSDSTPDADLLTAAQNGSLATDEGILAQVERLLKLENVKANIADITLDWFNVNQLFIKTKDPALFSKLPTADQDPTLIENDLFTSTQKFISDVLWNGSGKINDLVSSSKVFVNQRLATLYGYPFSGSSPDQFVAVDDPLRAGLLTQPAFIWAMSDPATTSIVKRGKFIHDDVVCQNPGPGPGALLDDPAIQAKLAMLPTEVDKSEYRMSTQPCKTCHEQLDPYALVLQNFDAIGAYRTMADGIPVDASTTFAGASPLAPQQISGALAFSKALVTSNLLTNCAAQKLSSYVIGRMIRVSSTCEVEQLQNDFAKTDGSMTSLFRLIALAKFTRVRSGGAQ